MNPDLDRLQPYPFERLRQLFTDITPAAEHPPINLSIGEPKHPTPQFISEAYAQALPGIASYPLTDGQRKSCRTPGAKGFMTEPARISNAALRSPSEKVSR